MKWRLLRLMASLLVFSGAVAFGAIEADTKNDPKALADGLRYQTGTIELKGGLARVTVPESLRFLDAKDATTVLSRLWGNPPDPDVLGLLMPTGMTPLDRGAWAVIVSYEEDGYVKDDDAAKINYTDLMNKMKEGTSEANAERTKQGYPAIDLKGWAAPPRYDQPSHKLYWAKQLQFAGDKEDTLNYNIRALGRRGVLVLNAVASMDQLPEIETAAPTILKSVDFLPGNRYADFNQSTDKVATYGIAALVAGGAILAAKSGLLKVLLGILLAAKKFVIIAIVGIGAAIKKFWAKITGKGRQGAQPSVTEV